MTPLVREARATRLKRKHRRVSVAYVEKHPPERGRERGNKDKTRGHKASTQDVITAGDTDGVSRNFSSETAGNHSPLTSPRRSAPDPKHVGATPEPRPNHLHHLRTRCELHPNHVRTTSEPHPKQWQKLRKKWFLARKRQFVHKVLFTIFVLLNPPLPTSKVMDFLSNFY